MRWPFAARLVAWLLAAVVLYQSGVYVERMHRYDGCTLVALNAVTYWACPVGVVRPQPVSGDSA